MKPIRNCKAIIIAAAMGKRIRQLTADKLKCMLEFIGILKLSKNGSNIFKRAYYNRKIYFRMFLNIQVALSFLFLIKESRIHVLYFYCLHYL